MPIDVEFAQVYIDSHIAPDAEPQFTEDEADAILAAARAIDANGVAPDGEGYEETYTYDSMHSAIYLAWTMKLAKAVELFEGEENEIFDHIQAMVNHWAGRISGIVVGGAMPVSEGSRSVATIPVW